MAILVLDQIELEVLSLVCGKQLNTFSSLKKIEGFTKEAFKTRQEAHIKIIDKFIADGAIWQSADGVPHLIRELQGVFSILNSPKKTVGIRSTMNRGMGVHYYSSIDDMGVLLSIGKDEVFYTVTYPVKHNVLSSWFKEEIIGDLGVEKTKIDFETTLSQDEFDVFSVLLMYNDYKKKMDLNNLITPDFLEFVDKKDLFKLNEAAAKSIIESENVETIVKQLESKKIINLSNGIVTIHDVLSNAFNTEQLRDIVEIAEVSPFNRAKNLYVTNLGYLIFEPIMSDVVTWKIKMIGLDTYPLKLVNDLINFSDFELSEILRKEMIKHMKPL